MMKQHLAVRKYFLGFFLGVAGLCVGLGLAACSDDDSGPTCGDGVCEGSEDETSCPYDCLVTVCGDQVCEGAEDRTTCPDDCAACGDGVCDVNEDMQSCPTDCPAFVCGNDVCEGGEDETSCPQDCTADNCGNGICESNENPTSCADDCSETKKVDLLFLIDNSGSMQNEQDQLISAFPLFYSALKDSLEVMPDLHVGAVTPDLGTGSYTSIRYCEEYGGDKGILGKTGNANQGEACLGTGQRYMVDLEPEGCTINRNSVDNCIDHDCSQNHCDAMAEGNEVLTLVDDENGCPRCRNFSSTPADAFSCLAQLGIEGCGFEQQLEAMHLALNEEETPENDGFLRDDALLVVVILTDEDDCSASRPDIIFDPDPNSNSIDSVLGFLHSFRCFEFGVTCDINDRNQMGVRQDCVPRDDDQALLHSIDRYGQFINTLRDPGRVVVAAIAGPVPMEITVQMDDQNRPEVAPSCVDSTATGATPGIRIEAFASLFNSPAALGGWAYASVCANSFESTMQALGLEIADRLGQQ